MPLDVNVEDRWSACSRNPQEWGQLDFLLHSIAFSPKEALHGRVVDVERDGFLKDDGNFLLVVLADGAFGRAADEAGWHMFTMTYYGSQMVVQNYNIMGVAKAALEAAVRYVAADLGPKGIRATPFPLAVATRAHRVFPNSMS